MKKTNLKTINVNELQAHISKIIKEVEKGETYQVMRYSQPVATIISSSTYQTLQGECKRCIEDLRKLIRKR